MKLYKHNGHHYILSAVSGNDAVARPWPLSETEAVEFLPFSEMVVVGEVNIINSKSSTPQPTPNQLPSNSQTAPDQLPTAAQSTPVRDTSNARAAKADFDPWLHYLQNLPIVELMMQDDIYTNCHSVSRFKDLRNVKKFPWPACDALNRSLGIKKSEKAKTKSRKVDRRDFYLDLYKIHQLVEAKRLPWFIEITDRFVIGLMQKLFTS